MSDKLILNCVFHEEITPSMILDQKSKSFECISCGKKGLIPDYPEVRVALLRHLFGNDNIFSGRLKEILFSRCSDAYPLQLVLNSGVIIEVNEMSSICFYDDHIQLYDNTHTDVVVHYPNDKSDFSFRHIWIPYESISFITDAAS